jgi:hypothetical protein
MGNWGIKVMKAGKAVTSTDPLDHVFSSSYGAVKIAKEVLGTLSFTGTADVSGTFSHNLGFAPMCLVYSELSANKWFMGFPYTPSETLRVSADSAKTYAGTAGVVVTYNQNAVGTTTARVKVFVMGDSG